MVIRFHQVVPAPLEGVFHPESDIWATEVDFQKGRRYLIHAPSGKGKSTFVHIAYGIRKDFKGDVLIDDKNILAIKPDEWAHIRQEKMSIVFQDLRLFPNLTALENIQVKSVLKPQEKDNILEMANFLGIDHVLHKPAAQLSFGERQRTAIIRALVQPFDYLLLDEPFSHLDEANIAKAGQLIREKCTENKASLIMVSLGYDYGFSFDEKLLLG